MYLLNRLKRNDYLWLVLMLASGFLLRLWLMERRWINPDEGAHLMDGRLALDGLVPGLDFDSRQPLYVYIIALVLRVFGISYGVGRFIPVTASLGIALFVFLIARKMFDRRVAFLATAIYLFTPFSVLWSVIVHTQPISVLLNCAGMYCVVSYVRSEKSLFPLVLAGASFSLAYYVRESALAMLVATFLYFLIYYRNRLLDFVKSYGVVLSGFLIVCAFMWLYYMQFASVSWIWDSSVNPLYLVKKSLSNIFASVGASAHSASEEGFRLNDQPWSSTLSEVFATVFFNSFLYVGLFLSVFVLGYVFFVKKEENGAFKKSVSFTGLLYLWFLTLSVFYLYWLLYRGFFMQYFEELLPPLVILLAFVIVYGLSELGLSDKLSGRVFIAGLVLASVFLVHNRFLGGIRVNSIFMALYVLATVLALSVIWFFPRLSLRRRLYAFLFYVGLYVFSFFVLSRTYGKVPDLVRGLFFVAMLFIAYLGVFLFSRIDLKKGVREGFGFVFVSVVLSSFALSFAISGSSMHLGYASTWSPEVVKEVSGYMRSSSDSDARVMSGGVIWEFESGRRPFMNLSHPTAFRPGIPVEEAQRIKHNFQKNPPRFVILDGYTEQTYIRHIKELGVIIDSKYVNKKNIENGCRYPVRVYELVDETRVGE
ncbi:hypothetical protein HRbin37_02057 [bacterium HR37]|nr:hypothetical protein HRbin37_02057 [bacterium HR37]